MKTPLAIAAVAMAAVMGGAALASEINVTDLFEMSDSNQDSVVTYREAQLAYPNLPEQIFKMADSNKDGVLDESEFWELSGLTAGFPPATQEKAPK